MLLPDEISRLYSERIFDLAGTTPSKRKIVCPLPRHQHANFTPSFSIFWGSGRWQWRCHGNCNLRGDAIDLAGYMYLPHYDPKDSESIAKAINVLTDGREIPDPVTPPERKQIGLSTTVWKQYCPPGPEVVGYARERGISRRTLDHFRVGQDEHWMTIPVFEDGKLQGIKLRNLERGLRYRSIKGSRTGLFNHDAVKYSTDKVYVVKGEIAAMVMHEHNLLACAPTGGESMVASAYNSILSLADLVVIGDNDRDPEVRKVTQKQAEDRAKELGARLMFPPENYKDVDEWILNDPSAVETLRRF